MTDDGDDATTGDESESETRLWLVDRSYDKNLVTLVYASEDGSEYVQKQLSQQLLMRRPVTAAIDEPTPNVEPVADDEQSRYADQARQMAASHDPDDEV